VLCTACGQPLTPSTSPSSTESVYPLGKELERDDYFGPDSTLVLVVSDSQRAFTLRPQTLSHEVVVGRRADSPLTIDVDLGAERGGKCGVSRLHLSIAYERDQHRLTIKGLGSLNGTYLNGRRLYREEVRVLQHRDRLRLGALEMRVYFNLEPRRR
jgi:pSer/pThr/pTyr-binding forkhead associated (FHA) protein